MGKSRDDTVASLTGEAQAEAADRNRARRRSLYGFQAARRQAGRTRRRGRGRQSRGFGRIHGRARRRRDRGRSNTSTVGTLGGMVNDYSSAQLMDMNRDKLARLGVDGATADSLFANRNYTPVDVTAMVEALASLGGVGNIERYGRAGRRRRQPRHRLFRPPPHRADCRLAAQPTRPIVAFVGADSIMVPAGPDRQAAGSSASIRSTFCRGRRRPRGRSSAMTAEAAAQRRDRARRSIITGTATPLARSNLAARGWKRAGAREALSARRSRGMRAGERHERE